MAGFNHISTLPSRARVSVASSANSRFEPTGIPYASLVTLTPNGLSSLEIYMAVVSPSVSGFMAMMTSSTSPFATRDTSSDIFRSSGPTWLIGESTPCSTWYTPVIFPAPLKAQHVPRLRHHADDPLVALI